MWRRLTYVIACVVTLGACQSMDINDFEGTEPRLVLEEYFAGESRAWGIFEDRFGNLRREFRVDILGTWDGTTLTLEEDFVYADGETDRRVWRIEKRGENGYVGRADDVLGVAEGEVRGKALNWSYDMLLNIGGSDVKVRFDDWMFLQADGVLINRATVSKFGIELGQVTLFFQRVGGQRAEISGREAA